MSTTWRKGWCPGALRPMQAKDGLLVRLRLTGGILPAATALAVADLSARHGNGLFDLSARGNLQMRGVREAALTALQDGLQALGLLDATPEAESIRNIIASPLAGLHGGLDIRPLVAALERRLADDATLHTLPGKFGFLVDDGSWPPLAGIAADVRFDWTGKAFSIGLGGTRDDALLIGRCAAAELVACAGTIAERAVALFAQHPEARRMRHLLQVLGAEALARELGGGKAPHPTSADADHIRGRLFSREGKKYVARDIVGLRTLDVAAPLPLAGRGEGWGSGRASSSAAQSTGTTPSPQEEGEALQHRPMSCLGLAAPFGRLDAQMLRDAAAIASQSPVKDLRLTPWRTLLIPGIEHLSKPLLGFITDPADPRLAIATCPGATGCARGTTDTHADATALAASLPPAPGIALHVSGCEKGCAKPSRTVVTLVARDGRYDLVRDGRAGDAPEHKALDLDAARKRILALEPA